MIELFGIRRAMCHGDKLGAFEKRFVFFVKKVNFQFTYTLGMDDCIDFLFKVCIKIPWWRATRPLLPVVTAVARW